MENQNYKKYKKIIYVYELQGHLLGGIHSIRGGQDIETTPLDPPMDGIRNTLTSPVFTDVLCRVEPAQKLNTLVYAKSETFCSFETRVVVVALSIFVGEPGTCSRARGRMSLVNLSVCLALVRATVREECLPEQGKDPITCGLACAVAAAAYPMLSSSTKKRATLAACVLQVHGYGQSCL